MSHSFADLRRGFSLDWHKDDLQNMTTSPHRKIAKVLTLTLALMCLSFALTLDTSRRALAEPERGYTEVHRLLSQWQTSQARDLYEQLAKSSSKQSVGMREATLGRLLSLEGRYGESIEAFDRAQLISPGLISQMGSLVARTRATHEALKGMNERVSDDGRFLVRFFKEDALLIPYLIDVLTAADQALSKDFEYTPPGRVVVEIYPSADYLAKVSTLTEEDIETSGTIALCSFNRLMFTSPRGLVRGYGWRDTVSHEFVHYYVTKYSANTVPIWLHEGIAKFQEIRWNQEPGRHLAPPQEDLLARSLAADQLISFDQMHPSMAKLPSQEAASLAFAEVHLVVEFLYKRSGYEGIRTLLKTLKTGAEMDEALLESFGFNLDGLWSTWLEKMKTEGFKTYPGLVQRSLRFKRPGQDEEPEAEYDSIEQKEVKDWAHLGELLRARDRKIAALREYRKAEAKGGDGHLVVQNGIATLLLDLNRAVDVPSTLQRVRDYYPTFLTTYINLGRAYLALSEPERAVLAFEEAVGINPFHPIPHHALAKLYRQLGATDLEARERETLEMMK
jgi:tetratricopeptide (TPR) repeat protein